ncbi:LysR substrate-binding domain-containing protein [Streptomyces sp. NPDC020883]|uniref:LysR substrate-binding domain-containing protein n=1 Tax=Streptomyces sp. NPDC020883 TaxID=3365099 RepID=UPI00379BA20B
MADRRVGEGESEGLRDQLSRAAGDQRLADINATPLRRWEFAGLHIQAELVATGTGVALLPASIAQGQAGVTAVRLAPRMQRTILALTRPTTQDDPAITACLQAAEQALSGGHREVASRATHSKGSAGQRHPRLP